MTSNEQIALSWNLLRYAYGAVLLLAGLDKIFGTDLIVQWSMYISPLVMSFIPSVDVFLFGMGVIEVAVALMLLTKFQRLAAYLSIAWLLAISVNLVMIGYLDIAIRDVLLAVGAGVLALLTNVMDDQRTPRS